MLVTPGSPDPPSMGSGPLGASVGAGVGVRDGRGAGAGALLLEPLDEPDFLLAACWRRACAAVVVVGMIRTDAPYLFMMPSTKRTYDSEWL